MDYLSSKQASKKWGVSVQRVQLILEAQEEEFQELFLLLVILG